MDPLVVRHTVLLPHRCGRVQLTDHFLRAKVLHRIPREAAFFSLVQCRDDGAPGAATALGDARFVETQTMKSDVLFVVGHSTRACKLCLLLCDFQFAQLIVHYPHCSSHSSYASLSRSSGSSHSRVPRWARSSSRRSSNSS